MNEKEHLIFDCIDELVSDFLYYDRRNDEDLPLGSIQDSIGVDLTIEDIVNRFRLKLNEGLN